MTLAPENVTLRNAIRKEVERSFVVPVEKIVYLGRQGELREVNYPSDGPERLRATRDRMVSEGTLGAIVHLCIEKAGPHSFYTMVQVFDDLAHPTLHAMLSWSDKPMWVEFPAVLQEEN